MCEMGVLYGWKYMAKKILDTIKEVSEHEKNRLENTSFTAEEKADIIANVIFQTIYELVYTQYNKQNYAHYFDIRTNHLNEKDWRRSFSINQMLYGMILYATADGTLHNSFDEILPILQKEFGTENKNEYTSDWR